jgi:predicted secreted protein
VRGRFGRGETDVSPFSALAVYFVTWWVTLFLVLPFHMRSPAADGRAVPGAEPSAPARPRIVRLFLINTGLSAAIFAGIYALLSTGLVAPENLYFRAGMHN